jgi:putative salt-induced outer membrane protein
MTGTARMALFGCLLLCGRAAFAQTAQDVSAAPAAAATVATKPTSTWKAGGEAGIVETGGNTQTESINTKIKVENDRERWRHRLKAEYVKSADSGEVTAEEVSAAYSTDYKVSAVDYFFFALRFDNDRFSGYTEQDSASIGYGRRFAPASRITLETEIGPGVRYTHNVGGGVQDDAILRVAGTYEQKFGAKSEFRQTLLSELAESNTHTEATTSLSSKVNGNLSLKMSYSWTHDSSVPEDTKNTDTTTSVTLVYDFET